MKPLSLGFIGGSTRSAVGYVHFVASAADKHWSLDAGCFSRDGARNRDSARRYGVHPDRLYADWREMLRRERGRLDALAVLTPTPDHAQVVLAALDVGFPVICEKALVANSREAVKIIAARKRSRGFLAVTYNYSGYPMLRELRHRIRQGELGDILHFQAEMPQEGFRLAGGPGKRPAPPPWRLTDGRVPVIYLDLAVHLHQLVHYLTGRTPLEVIAAQASCGRFPRVVDNVSALLRYSGGIQGQMWFSKSALGQRNGLMLRIFGSRGAAEWLQADPEELLLAHADGRREIVDRASPVAVAGLSRYNRFKAGHPAGFIEAFANLYADMAESLRQYRSVGRWRSAEVFGAELALEGLRLIEAMVRSAKTKRWQVVQAGS